MRQQLQYASHLLVIGILALAACRGGASAMTQGMILRASASAVIVEPLDINKTADLQFGRAFFSPNANTITVAPDGTRTASDSAILGPGDSVTAACFLLYGVPNNAFHIFPPHPNRATLTNGAQTITVDAFTCSIPTNRGRLGSDGLATFTFGATVHLNAAQAPGWYTGTFLVSVNYE